MSETCNALKQQFIIKCAMDKKFATRFSNSSEWANQLHTVQHLFRILRIIYDYMVMPQREA